MTSKLIAKYDKSPAAPNTKSSLGPSVLLGEIRYLSVSQMTSFDPASFGGCNRRWWFRYVARKKEPETRSQKLGTQMHAQLEHYLRTGEDVLGEIARSGFRFLPKPGPDLLVEYKFGKLVELEPGGIYGPITSPLTVEGVPLIGAVDLMHNRGEWLDDDGKINPLPNSAEVLDHKSTKQIDNVVDEITGVVTERGYSKTAAELAKTWQMLGYGKLALEIFPSIDVVSLAHSNYQTKGPRAASKRAAILTAAEVLERWDEPAKALVKQMKVVARAERVEDVTPNYSACSAYRGCPHKAICPRDPKRVLAELFGGSQDLLKRVRADVPKGAVSMSLLAKMKAKNAAPPLVSSTVPSASVMAHSKAPDPEAVRIEIERLKAEEVRLLGSVTPPDQPKPEKIAEPIPADVIVPANVRAAADAIAAQAVPPMCKACGSPAATFTKLPNGTVVHHGCPATSSELIASAIAANASAPPAGVCAQTGETTELSMDDVIAKKAKCTCGATYKIKPIKLGDGKVYTLVPKHDTPTAAAPNPNLINVTATITKEPAPPVTQAEVTAALVETLKQFEGRSVVDVEVTRGTKSLGVTQLVEIPPSAAAVTTSTSTLPSGDVPIIPQGFTLYLDCSEDGVATQRLEAYADKLAAALCEEYKAADIRAASNDSALGFGRWKGALAAFARSAPPEFGAWSCSSGSELAMIAFEAIAPLARRVVRGGR